MKRPGRSALLPGFTGVALADILANGVAMVVILIAITVSVRNAQEQERLEQAQDVSVLLSRELATSVVMNALPTSPPSVLHDYERSPLDQNPQHSLMPILELRKEGVRNRYNGRLFRRRELLRQDNALDRYLQSLSPVQRQNLRLDVLSIRNFYIAMSIFKQNGVRPFHWHFLGEAAGGQQPQLAGGGGESLQRGAPPEALQPGERPGLGRRPGAGDFQLPAGARFGPDNDQLAYPNVGPPGRRGGGRGRPGRRTMRFRLPSPESLNAITPRGARVQVNDAQVLAALYRYMEDIQRRSDAGEYDALARSNLRRALAQFFAEPPSFEEYEHAAALVESLKQPWPGPPDGVAVRRVPTAGASALQLGADARQRRVLIREHQSGEAKHPGAQSAHAGEGDAAAVQLRMGQWPAIYRGLTIPLYHGGLALVAPGQQSPRAWRWRLVALTDSALSDGTIGFVYAALDAAGNLLLAGEENSVTVNGLPLRSAYAAWFLRNERMLLLLYGLLVLFMLAMLTRRFRR